LIKSKKEAVQVYQMSPKEKGPKMVQVRPK